MTIQTDSRPYYFEVYYRTDVGVGRENEHLTQFHYPSMADALADRRRVLSEADDSKIDFEVSDIRGPNVIHHYVGLTESQRQVMQLRLAVPEIGDPMDEPF